MGKIWFLIFIFRNFNYVNVDIRLIEYDVSILWKRFVFLKKKRGFSDFIIYYIKVRGKGIVYEGKLCVRNWIVFILI